MVMLISIKLKQLAGNSYDKVIGDRWIDKVGDYYFHYAVRPQGVLKRGVFKPFTKGFIAALCGASVIMPTYESEALYYLPDDYPYFLNDVSYDSVMNMLRFCKDTFMSSEWEYAMEVMRFVKSRCSNDFIVSEFRDLLKHICVID